MMKKIICAALLFLGGSLVFAEIDVPFFGNNNFTIDASTIFTADANDGSTGLLTDVGVGLWFEFTPYSDRNINPQRDTVSVSLKLANSAFYAWRGYDLNGATMYDGDQTPSDVTMDQATSIWFDTFIAQLEYNQWWMRVAGIEPEITVSQASIKSVFDPIMDNRTAVDKNEQSLPLFHGDGNHYNGNGGVVGLISRDIVHLNRREVVIAGNVSAGMKGENFDFDLKASSWKKGEENIDNSWAFGGDAAWRPDLTNSLSFSFLTAMNYGEVTMSKNDPMANPKALIENPVALGLGYDYRINLPRTMVMKPYAGVDFIYETQTGEYNCEVGGGLQWFFRGTSSQFKRNEKIGGVNIGDVNIPAALIAGMNVDKNGFMNAIVSFNEDPRSSPLRNVGGYLQAEFMNLTGMEYLAPDGEYYNEFMFAAIGQLEYLVHKNIMPYVFAKFIPADTRGLALVDPPVYRTNRTSVTSKAGCRFTPFSFFAIDLWYERTDVRVVRDWTLDNGQVSINFAVRNYL